MKTPVSHASPPSWLVLERYALGELTDTAHAEIKAALEADEETRACLDRITSDRRPLRPLPSLDAHAPSRLPSRDTRAPSPRAARPWRWIFALGPILVAATLLIVLWPRSVDMTSLIAPKADHRIPSRLSVKGGEIAIVLVRDRKGIAQRNPTSYRSGDRFKVLVTSPPRPASLNATGAKATSHIPQRPAEVVVFQGGKIYLPLPRNADLPSGNGVPVAGAFSLDGADPVDVCVITSDGGALPSREMLQTLTKP
ncbi:MAG: hypothetical protein KAI47_05940, partial [Deltaproteobacteria bacterium]|nr:hypothetical protein [Deltaproteobacteria bacterium]